MEQIKDFVDQLSSQMGIKTLESCEDFRKQFPNVQLTELEQEAALYYARQQKSYLLDEEAKRAKREAFEAEIHRPFTAEELYAIVMIRAVEEFGFSANGGEDRKPVFVIDDTNRAIIESLCCYHTNDDRFETESLGKKNGWKLDKGLMMLGTTGLGKTKLMHMFARNKRQSYVVVSCRKVGDMYTKDGADALEFYSGPREEAFGDPRVYYQRTLGYCFDDLGTEDVKNNFGNKVDVMSNIILNRYDKSYDLSWNQTHITTNLSGDEIEQFYGSRVRSRLREMFNPIILTGKDRR